MQMTFVASCARTLIQISISHQDSSLQGGELSQFNGLTMLQFDRPVVGVDAGGEGAGAVAPPSPSESAALHTMREGWQDMIWAMGEDDNDVVRVCKQLCGVAAVNQRSPIKMKVGCVL